MSSYLHPYNPQDSHTFYSEFYSAQVGHGLNAYAGRQMVGNGFGSLLSKLAKKALPYAKVVGKRLLNTGVDVVKDYLGDNQSFEESAEKHLTNAGSDILKDFNELSASKKKRTAHLGKRKRVAKNQRTKRSKDIFSK